MAVKQAAEKQSDEGDITHDALPSVVVMAAAIFRDKQYTSRTLILPDGAVVQVAKGQITADTPELLAFLSDRKDFERLLE